MDVEEEQQVITHGTSRSRVRYPPGPPCRCHRRRTSKVGTSPRPGTCSSSRHLAARSQHGTGPAPTDMAIHEYRDRRPSATPETTNLSNTSSPPEPSPAVKREDKTHDFGHPARSITRITRSSHSDPRGSRRLRSRPNFPARLGNRLRIDRPRTSTNNTIATKTYAGHGGRSKS